MASKNHVQSTIFSQRCRKSTEKDLKIHVNALYDNESNQDNRMFENFDENQRIEIEIVLEENCATVFKKQD